MHPPHPALRQMLCALGIGLAGAAAAAPAAWMERTLKPGGLHEECMKLKRGSRLDYAFETPAKLDFNIHYHAGSVVHYPVMNKDAQRLETSFRPAMAQDYCMMWSNPGAAPLPFRYRFAVSAGGSAATDK